LNEDEIEIAARVVRETGAKKKRGRITSIDPLVIAWEDGSKSAEDPRHLRLSKNQRAGQHVMTLEVEICELGQDTQDLVLARVRWDGEKVQFSGDEETCESVSTYTSFSDPTGTVEDGLPWVASLPYALDGVYFWARYAEAPEQGPTAR
jgi:hypothetical protein